MTPRSPFPPAPTLSLLTLACLLSACPPATGGTDTDTDSDSGTTTTGSTSDPTTSTTQPTDGTTTGDPGEGEVALNDSREVDILFVIDNSGSMATSQAALSKSAAGLFGVLEAPDQRLDFRVGFTTTDSGNPRCPKATYTPEGGKLVLSSCVDRVSLGEFTFFDQDFSFACTDFCPLTDADLPIKPTETQVSDGQKEPRKWIESTNGATNLPDGVNATQAFQCFAPQGVAGCGFESHLESMYLALAQSSRQDSPTNYGFIRDSARLAVVIVSDEADCSASQLGSEIFTTNKVYWNDPSDPAPTSAVCWRAGVRCDGAGPTYDDCSATNWDLSGNADAPDDQAVLQPLAKYINFVQGIEDQKRALDPTQDVIVALIAGVPDGYAEGLSELIYEDSADPDYQFDFGIGPGCLLPGMNGEPDRRAVPPVREREFAEAFQIGDQRDLHSVCRDDYSAALASIAERITDQILPTCMPYCLADSNPGTQILEPDCQLFDNNLITDTKTPIVPCEPAGDAWQIPPGETACFGTRVDAGNLTPSSLDDMDPRCVAEGYNAEFVVLRAAPKPAGVTVTASCVLSDNKAQDCPLL